MNKRIRRSTRVADGHIIHIAEVQIRLGGPIWITAKVIEDPNKQYVEARAEEVLEYLEDERYAERVKERHQVTGKVSQRCCAGV
jgi:hypothetical protein